jgi:hypothetical protein
MAPLDAECAAQWFRGLAGRHGVPHVRQARGAAQHLLKSDRPSSKTSPDPSTGRKSACASSKRQNEVAKVPSTRRLLTRSSTSSHLAAHFDPASCAACDFFVFCRNGISSRTTRPPPTWLIETWACSRRCVSSRLGLVRQDHPARLVPSSVQSSDRGHALRRRREVRRQRAALDPHRCTAGTINRRILAKSDGADARWFYGVRHSVALQAQGPGGRGTFTGLYD